MYSQIISLIRQEVKPALGCTEPVAVALAAAKSCEILSSTGEKPEKIEAAVSANILKNGMGVGIPGTGMTGLNIAVALAAVCGKSKYGLEVLKELNDTAVANAKKMVEEGKVKITLADTAETLFVRASAYSANHMAEAVVSGSHDTVTGAFLDGNAICSGISSNQTGGEADSSVVPESAARDLTVSQIWEFANNVPLDEIEFMMDSVKMNEALVKEGLEGDYGLKVGKTIAHGSNSEFYGDSLLIYAMSCTAAASDARMAGSTLPAMSNSGSGNQGITVTVPVIAVAEKINASHEQLVRALALAHTVAIHIKGHLGKLSALCGCVIASTGAACGIVYLKGGGYEEICAAIKNMIGNITGMVCDGAKVGCAMKVASGVACAMQSAVLALEGTCISPNDGIIEEDIEKTISNLGRIGSKGMQTTDKMILDIMVCK